MNKNQYKALIILVILMLFPIVASAQQAINLEIVIPDSYKKTVKGNKIYFTINLLNLGANQRFDVTLKYDLLNKNNEILATNSKTVAIETQASIVGNLDIPDKLSQGEYLLRATVFYPEGESKAETTIYIKEKEDINPFYYLIIFFVALVLLGLIIIIAKPIVSKIELRNKIHKIVKNKNK